MSSPMLISSINKTLRRPSYLLSVLLISLLTLPPGSALAQTNDLELKQRKDLLKEKTVSLPGREAKVEFQIQLEPKTPDIARCQMAVVVSYLQYGDRAQVDSTLENRDCPASSGEYTVRLRIRDSTGKIQLLEHVESWARDDDAAIETQKFYDIGSDVDLIRVSTAKITCVCGKPDT